MTHSPYNIDHWGNGFFGVDKHGKLLVYPNGKHSQNTLVLADLVNELTCAGIALPILVRFVNILHQRLAQLHQAFTQAGSQIDTPVNYISVYPIKVNQQKQVISEILRAGSAHDDIGKVGLEAGSKPELLAVLGLSETPESIIICNGYKDREYIRSALIGQKMGHRVYIIIENLTELDLVLTQANALKVTPQLGVRVRLHATAHGRWQNSGGEKSKFGLSACQVLQMVEQLKKAKQLDTLVLLHCHMGSQIANIRDIQRGLQELSRYYTELHALGAPIALMDIGGGLSVDYTGLRSRQGYSMNYTLQEYANNVVHIVHEAAKAAQLPMPTLITETGRALVAHHAVLVTDIIEVARPVTDEKMPSIDKNAPQVLQNLWLSSQMDPNKSILERYHDIHHWMSEAQSAYTHGLITLTILAQAEKLYWQACANMQAALSPDDKAHQDLLETLSQKLSDKLFVNFSVFQSLPDVWAINQTFPIMPLTHLHKPLNHRATLHDITCDSDGCIHDYVGQHGLEKTLAVPDFQTEKPAWLGVFLVGAYQEILGDMHNLLGDTHAVNVEIDEAGRYHYDLEVGDTVSDVLRYVHLDLDPLKAQYQAHFNRSTDLTAGEKRNLLTELLEGLQGYTYLED